MLWMLAAAVALHGAIDESAAEGLEANAHAGFETRSTASALSGHTRSAATVSAQTHGAAAVSAQTHGAAARPARTRAPAAVGDSLGQVLAAIVDELAGHGFENVAAVAETGRIIVTYENRLYRYEAAAMREVLRRVTQRIGSDRAIALVPQRRQTPLLAVTFGSDENDCADPGAAKLDAALRSAGSAAERLRTTAPSADRSAAPPGAESESARSAVAPAGVTTAVGRYWTMLQHARRANSSLFKVDLALGPELAVQLGNYNDPVESQVNLVPSLSVSLWKGMAASARLVIPLQNELGEEGDDVRPGLLVVSQLLRLPRNVYAVGSVGYFTENRYGVDLQVRRYFAGGRWAASMNAGYTGRARFMERTWYYTGMQDLTWQAALEHYVPRYTLMLRAAAGRFVYGDGGIRVDVLREFGEVHLGIFGLHTDQGSNAGVAIALPLPFRKYTRPALLRIRPERTFRWEYRFKGFPRIGASYSTGTPASDLWYGISPAFIGHANSLRNVY